MIKTLIIGLIVFAFSSICYAQNLDTLKSSILRKLESVDHHGKNELKFNILYAINGKPEITYERIVRNNMGVGAAMFVAIDNSVAYKFGFAPYYRLYFGKKKGSGLFIEANTGIITLEDEYYVDVSHIYKITNTNLTLGVAAGAKYLTRNGFFIEAYLGWGKLVADRIGYYTRDFPRNGIVLGKRF